MRCFGKKIQNYHCKIVLLDEQELIQEIQDTTTGQEILDVVFRHLNLLETAYFGVRYLDSSNQTHWLDPTKKIAKQLKGTDPFTLYFGVKFYAADPCKLLEEITRYQFFLQVKQDILQGRLPVPFDLAAELGSYVVQSELGDYDPRRHSPGYVSEFRFLSNQTVELESRISELHKGLVGQIPAVAELNYLEKVKWLDMYGVDLHPVLGEDNVEYFLGLTPSGIIVLRNKTKVGNYYWPRITKVYFKGRYFMLRVCDKNNDENTYGFETPSKQACKHLWKCCVEHHAFFRLVQVSPQTPDNIFNLGSRFSGRTEKQAQRDAQMRLRTPPQFTRTPSRRYQRRIVEGAQDAPKVEEGANKENIPSQENNTVSTGQQQMQSNASVYRSTSIPNGLPRSDSPRSCRSAPWTHTNKGLYSCASPRSVRSAGHNPTQFLNRLTRRSSSVESQSSTESRTCKRHRHHRSRRGSDNDSEVSKASARSHHRRHRSHQKRDSGSESEHHHRHRHRGSKHRHGSNYELVDSQAQWKEVQRKQAEGQPGIQQATVVRDLGNRKSGYMNSGMETESEASYHHKKKHKKHRSRSRSPSESKTRLPDELKKHLEFDLIETEGMTEDQLRQIPYKVVETATKAPKIKFSPSTKRRQRSPRRSKSSTQDERHQLPNSGDSPPPPYSPPNGGVGTTEIPGTQSNSSVNFTPTTIMAAGSTLPSYSSPSTTVADFVKNSSAPSVNHSPAGTVRSNHMPRAPLATVMEYPAIANTDSNSLHHQNSSGLPHTTASSNFISGMILSSSSLYNSGKLIGNGNIPNGHIAPPTSAPNYPSQPGLTISHEHSDSGLGAESQDYSCGGRTNEGPKYAQTTKLSTTYAKPVSISKAYHNPTPYCSTPPGNNNTPTSSSTLHSSSHLVNHYSPSVQKHIAGTSHAYRDLGRPTNISEASGDVRQNHGLGWHSGASQGLYSVGVSSPSTYHALPLSPNATGTNHSTSTPHTPNARSQETRNPPAPTNALGNWNYPPIGEMPRLQGPVRLGSIRSVQSGPPGGWPLYFQSSDLGDSSKLNTEDQSGDHKNSQGRQRDEGHTFRRARSSSLELILSPIIQSTYQ